MNFPLEYTSYNPGKMSLYGLLRSVLFGNLSAEESIIFQKHILSRVKTLIDEIRESIAVEDREVFMSFLEKNIVWICKKCFQEGEKEFMSGIDSDFSEYRKRELNNAILYKIMRKNLSFIFKEKYGVFSDYKKCFAAQKGELCFSYFQKAYKGVISRFAYKYHKTFFMEIEDMKQELEVVMWKCILGYKGQNFSRFSTYLKRALKNKICDMYDAKFTHKRIINVYTVLYPPGEDESYTQHLVDSVTHKSWEILNREYEKKNDAESSGLRRGYQNTQMIEEILPTNL